MTENKRIAILQSNYIPWKGYFDIINMVDEFVIYDSVQYTKNDWRNRNLIKTAQGTKWLTVPVFNKNHYHQNIRETKIVDQKWALKHWKSIYHAYSKAEHFADYTDSIERLYRNSNHQYLSDLNYDFIALINSFLGINTKLSWSHDFKESPDANEQLISICLEAGASKYISGPAAKGYLDEELFLESGIKVKWMDYNDYPEYKQLYPPFEHKVSILDLLFNCGAVAHRYMKSFE